MNHDIKVVKLPSGVERYELRIWWDGWRAKQIKRRFETKKDAQNFLYALAKEGEEKPSDETYFSELYQHWYTTKAVPEFAPGWLKTVEGYWVSMSEALSKKRVHELNKEFLKVIELSLLASGNSKKTVRNKLGFILAVLNYAKEFGKIKSFPCEGYKLPKPPAAEIDFWESESASDFLRVMAEKYPVGSEKRYVYSLYLTALNTGLRSGELWALRPSSIKFDRGVLRVSEQFNRVSREFTVLKGKEPRSVPLNSVVASELQSLIKEKKIKLHDLIFTSQGTPMCHDNFLTRVFDKDLEMWKGPVITFHGLRHTAATLMLSSGANVKTVQKVLGHKDIQTTMKYLHLLDSDVSAMRESFFVKALKPELRAVK
jgi:integrase